MLQNQFLLKAILNQINPELNSSQSFKATTAKARSSLDFVLQTCGISWQENLWGCFRSNMEWDFVVLRAHIQTDKCWPVCANDRTPTNLDKWWGLILKRDLFQKDILYNITTTSSRFTVMLFLRYTGFDPMLCLSAFILRKETASTKIKAMTWTHPIKNTSLN